jgi:UDPglucose 6-dehydrogenase/GDP-mannose 6-dehydrogenase
MIGRALRTKNDYHVVVVKSTVVPGTTEDVVTPVLERTSGKRCGRDFGVGMNPEFLREGEAVADFQTPDRIVIGAADARVLAAMDRLYEDFPSTPRIYTNSRTAEMIKYSSNALFATLISFANEIGHLCSIAGEVDVTEVMHGVHLDRRITTMTSEGAISPGIIAYLKAGCGFGGSCFPKDLAALVCWGKERAQPTPLLDAVEQINRHQPLEIVRLLEKHFVNLCDVRVAVLGLAFKPGTDDVRESPSLHVISELRKLGAQISAYDPVAMRSARAVLGDEGIAYEKSVRDAIRDVDAVVVLTAWAEFQQLSNLLDAIGTSPVVIDARRVLQRSRFSRYDGIGLSSPTVTRGPVRASALSRS